MSTKNKQQLQQELSNLQKEKEQLLSLKKADEKKFTKDQQARLDEIVEAIVDLEEQIELAPEEEPKKEDQKKGQEQQKNEQKAIIAKGSEKLVQVKISTGDRFDRKTGKEIPGVAQPQSFNFGEWQLFKKNFKRLGYTIVEVMNDPFGDAKALINK